MQFECSSFDTGEFFLLRRGAAGCGPDHFPDFVRRRRHDGAVLAIIIYLFAIIDHETNTEAEETATAATHSKLLITKHCCCRRDWIGQTQ